MVNYGYDCQGWSETAKRELAAELEKLVANVRDQNGRPPEVEINGTYGGVRIRKLTWLTEEQIDKLTIEADAIVDKIAKKMKVANVRPRDDDNTYRCFFDGFGPLPSCVANKRCPYLANCHKKEANE